MERLNANIARIEDLSQRLVTAMAAKKSIDKGLHAPSQDVFVKAASAYMSSMVQNPARMMEQQVGYWGKMLKHYVDSQHVLTSGKFTAPADPTPADRRFANPMWDSHPYFNYIKQNYLLTSEAIDTSMAELEGLEEGDKRRVSYFTQQIVDLFSPSNFLATNPDALERAVETDGQSLVDGLENLVRDIEDNDGELVVSLADKKAFEVGVNLGATPGSVVFRNRMFELIQYTPTTETVYKTPLVVFPPWINKFYVLDMKEQNSFIKWVVDQGITLFVVSWVNPDETYAEVGMTEYMEEGFIEAITQVKAITGEAQINAVGYCIGGTTLSLTAAVLEKRGDKSLKSATLFTTMTDFSEPGEIGVFLDNDFVDGIEREAAATGILNAFIMSRTFSYLRSNDLIYGPAIKSYMMGKAPPAFDLLYWNGDNTNLPAKMAVEYLRGLCQQNRFAGEGFAIGGETVKLADVKVPVCAIACETDHIAGWKASFGGVCRFGSRTKTFIMAESGHIAGIVNPPSKKKYGHYTNADMKLDADEWLAKADFNEGSWWPRWKEWLAKRSGKQVPARIPGDSDHPVLVAAPGTYVLNKRTA